MAIISAICMTIGIIAFVNDAVSTAYMLMLLAIYCETGRRRSGEG